jgi:hypothetical protein
MFVVCLFALEFVMAATKSEFCFMSASTCLRCASISARIVVIRSGVVAAVGVPVGVVATYSRAMANGK